MYEYSFVGVSKRQATSLGFQDRLDPGSGLDEVMKIIRHVVARSHDCTIVLKAEKHNVSQRSRHIMALEGIIYCASIRAPVHLFPLSAFILISVRI